MPPETGRETRPSLLGMPAERGRWILVLCGMGINLCLGTIYSWSVFVGPLTIYFKESLGEVIDPSGALLPFSVFLACFSIAMPLAGRFIESHGPRVVAIAGGVLTGAGWILASLATSVPVLCVLYGVIGGAGVGITYGVPVAVTARWFPDRRGLAVGLSLLGFGFSAFITANIAGALMGSFGVPGTFQIFGTAFIILTILLALPLVFPPPGWQPAGWTPPAAGPGSAPPATCNRNTMVRTGRFYALWFCYFTGCLAGLMAISIAKPVGTELAGIETGLATFLVGFFAIFNGGGRPLFGALTDRIGPSRTAIISFILIGFGAAIIWQAPNPVTYILAFAILWGCLGGWLAIAPAATGCYFGTGDYPRCYGIIFLAYGAGAIAGPMLAGMIRTSSGSYAGVFPWVFILALAGILVAWRGMGRAECKLKTGP